VDGLLVGGDLVFGGRIDLGELVCRCGHDGLSEGVLIGGLVRGKGQVGKSLGRLSLVEQESYCSGTEERVRGGANTGEDGSCGRSGVFDQMTISQPTGQSEAWSRFQFQRVRSTRPMGRAPPLPDPGMTSANSRIWGIHARGCAAGQSQGAQKGPAEVPVFLAFGRCLPSLLNRRC